MPLTDSYVWDYCTRGQIEGSDPERECWGHSQKRTNPQAGRNSPVLLFAHPAGAAGVSVLAGPAFPARPTNEISAAGSGCYALLVRSTPAISVQQPAPNHRTSRRRASGGKHSPPSPHSGEEREPDVKKRMLLFASFAAVILSLALLITPAGASVTSHCTSCTAIDSTGAKVTSTCHVAPIDACFCPLSGQIISNNCLRLP